MPSDPVDLFVQAGDAACLLEDMGYVAVARKRDGAVVVELWRHDGTQQGIGRYVVDGPFSNAAALAEHCRARFEAG